MAYVQRIKDLQQRSRRPPSPSDSAEKVRERSQLRKEKGRVIRGQIEYGVDSDEKKVLLMNKLDLVKTYLGDGKASRSSNYQVLETVFNYFIANNLPSTAESENETTGTIPTPVYQHCAKEDTNEDIFLTTMSALKNLTGHIQEHSHKCPSALELTLTERKGHVAMCQLSCKAVTGHKFHWNSSPYIGSTVTPKFLVNYRVGHGYFSSGMLHANYVKFCEAANIGAMKDLYLNTMMDMYAQEVGRLAELSCKAAIEEEMGDGESIDILSDARHGWRKNSFFTDVVFLGHRTHKCIRLELVTKLEDKCSQRHEMVGVKKFYKWADENDVKINIQGHDRNTSINKFIREKRPEVHNTNDTWHVSKEVGKAMSKISKGAKYKHGKTWHQELSDKAASVKTHFYWAMKTCGESEVKLLASLDTIVNHYTDIHTNCSSESRCKKDPHYIPSKIVLESDIAKQMLTNTIKSTPIYKSSKDYILCRDTHYVESFNNAMLQYHDKRISYGQTNYRLRSDLSVLDWNEHVDRKFTSVKMVEDAANPRRKTGFKRLCKKSYNFKQDIWDACMERVYL